MRVACTNHVSFSFFLCYFYELKLNLFDRLRVFLTTSTKFRGSIYRLTEICSDVFPFRKKMAENGKTVIFEMGLRKMHLKLNRKKIKAEFFNHHH